MIEPRPEALLDGIAASLEQTVLPELARGPVRNQVREAIRVARRVALVLDRIDPTLSADIADMAETLEWIGSRHPGAESGLRARLTHVVADTDPASLRQRHVALQDILVSVDAAVHDLPDATARADALGRLRALYRRMLARERELTQPDRGSA